MRARTTSSASSAQALADSSIAVEGKPFALTAPQVAIWLDQALHPHKPIYNTGQAITIHAGLDVDHFVAALRSVVEENDALRLRFLKGADIRQEIASDVDFEVNVRDFAAEDAPDAAADAWIEHLFWEPFEPTDFPLFRFALAKVSADRFVWLQKYHHLIIDAGGRQLVAARAAALYNAQRAGKDVLLPQGGSCRLAKQLEDAYLSSEQYGIDREYWTARFADPPQPLVRTAAHLSEKSRSGRPTRLDCGLTAAGAAGLRAFAREQGSSVFKVMLALAWSCASRIYATRDLVVGVPLANRPTSTAKQTVGLFSKVLPFRMRLDPTMPFRAALHALDAALSEDLQHQGFPSDHISRDSQLRRGRAGLFDIGVNYVRGDYGFDIAAAPIACANLSAGFAVPWSIMGLEFGGDQPLRIVIDYDPGRIRSDEAEYFLRSLQALLSSAPQSAHIAIGELPMGCEAVPPLQTENDAASTPASASRPRVPTDSAPEKAADDVERDVLEIWQACFEGRSLVLNDDYFELGGTSLQALRLIAECNDRFGIDLPLTVLFEHSTPIRLAGAIRAAAGSHAPSLVVELREGRGGAPLLLIHPVAGTLLCYLDLVSRLPRTAPIYGVRASGLHAGEELPSSIENMAEGYLALAANVVGSGPWHLAGWSFGGLVAFEIGRRLAASGNPPASLTLIDTPSRPRFRAGQDDSMVLTAVAGALGLDLGTGGAPSTAAITSAAVARAGLPQVAEEQIERMAAIVRHARDLRGRYALGRYGGPVTLLRASSNQAADDHDFDWRGLIDGPLEVFSFQATHDTILLPPHVEHVAAILTKVMAGGRV